MKFILFVQIYIVIISHNLATLDMTLFSNNCIRIHARQQWVFINKRDKMEEELLIQPLSLIPSMIKI